MVHNLGTHRSLQYETWRHTSQSQESVSRQLYEQTGDANASKTCQIPCTFHFWAVIVLTLECLWCLCRSDLFDQPHALKMPWFNQSHLQHIDGVLPSQQATFSLEKRFRRGQVQCFQHGKRLKLTISCSPWLGNSVTNQYQHISSYMSVKFRKAS